MASFDYNPITGQLDLVGSGGGSYIDGEVEYHSNLPVTVGTPAVNSAFLVRKGEGLYFISRKPAGIWVRELNNGNLDDWKYAGTFSDLYRDANFRIISDSDVSKELAFSLSGITTGTTRTITVPDKNITLDDAGDSRTPSSHASSHASAGSDPLFDQDLNTTDAVTFESVTATDVFGLAAFEVVGVSPNRIDINGENGITFFGTTADSTRTNLGLGTAAVADIGNGAGDVAEGNHGHGNITSDGKIGSTAGLPLKTGTAGVVEAGVFGTGAGEFAEGNHTHTQLHDKSHSMTDATSHTAGNHKVFYSNGSGEIVELALGNSGEVLTSNGASAAPSFAAASGGVTGAAASASDVLGVSGSDITGVDATADRIVFWDDSASALKYLEAGSGLSISGTTLTATASGAASQTDVFTANGTWTKPAGAKSIHYVLVGGGGGGGSGRRGAASTNRYSGGGGGGAAIVYGIMDAANAGSTETVTVGAGGTGGASPADSTNGNAGTAGGQSSFGTIVKAIGGNAGGGGTNSAGGAGGTSAGAGTSIYNGISNVATGAAGAQINGATAAQQASVFQPTGGGSGSGISSGNSRGTGGAGGVLGSSNVGQTAGGTGGSNGDGGNGNNSLYWAGTGGGGGQANSSVSPIRGQKGGTGGIGAGGGGGSGATDADGGDNAGGDGGNGVVVITTYF